LRSTLPCRKRVAAHTKKTFEHTKEARGRVRQSGAKEGSGHVKNCQDYTYVLERSGRVVVVINIPQAPRRHTNTLALHLANHNLHHRFVRVVAESCRVEIQDESMSAHKTASKGTESKATALRTLDLVLNRSGQILGQQLALKEGDAEERVSETRRGSTGRGQPTEQRDGSSLTRQHHAPRRHRSCSSSVSTWRSIAPRGCHR
jgi:hypothetical protein